MCGLNAKNEEPNNLGKSDIVVEYFDNRVWIIEIKIDRSSYKAIDQIKEKEYYNRYVDKEIYLVGININSKERKVNDIKIIENNCYFG
jgi:RecB family endonuclease NucS